MSLLVGLDIGTSGGRCLVVDEEGRQVGEGSRPWSYRWEGLGVCELDPDQAFAALSAAARDALAGLDTSEIVGVGVASQRTGVVLLDENGVELYTGPNADGRGVASGMDLERSHGDRIYRTNGRLPVMLYLPARLGWFRANRPDVLHRAWKALSLSDWLVYRLTGAIATEPTQAAEMLVYDLAGGTWSEELCDVLEVPTTLLPPIRPQGEVAGTITARAAEAFGFPADVPTVAGGCDTQCAALSLDAGGPGSAVVVGGRTMLVQHGTADPIIDEGRRLWTSPHPAGGFVVEVELADAGVAIDWMANVMGEVPGWFDSAAAASEPGAGGLFFVDASPSPAGDFPLLRTGQFSFPAPLLVMARSREDVARAVLEGIAFAAKAGLEWTQQVAGSAERFSVTGGVARSRTFARILATVAGAPFTVATQANGPALGAAMVASVGAGVHGSVLGAAKAMADRGEDVEPEPSWEGPTASAYAGWRERVRHMDENAVRVSHMIGEP